MKMTIKELVARKSNIAEESSAMRDILREKFKAMRKGKGEEDTIMSDIDKNKLGEECKRWVLYILFKTHHLLRTNCREGVCSTHGSKYEHTFNV